MAYGNVHIPSIDAALVWLKTYDLRPAGRNYIGTTSVPAYSTLDRFSQELISDVVRSDPYQRFGAKYITSDSLMDPRLWERGNIDQFNARPALVWAHEYYKEQAAIYNATAFNAGAGRHLLHEAPEVFPDRYFEDGNRDLLDNADNVYMSAFPYEVSDTPLARDYYFQDNPGSREQAEKDSSRSQFNYSPFDMNQDGVVSTTDIQALYYSLFTTTFDFEATDYHITPNSTRNATEMTAALKEYHKVLKDGGFGSPLFNVFDVDGDGKVNLTADLLMLYHYVNETEGVKLQDFIADGSAFSEYRDASDRDFKKFIEKRITPFMPSEEHQDYRVKANFYGDIEVPPIGVKGDDGKFLPDMGPILRGFEDDGAGYETWEQRLVSGTIPYYVHSAANTYSSGAKDASSGDNQDGLHGYLIPAPNSSGYIDPGNIYNPPVMTESAAGTLPPPDNDEDGIPNIDDPDDDNDGTLDVDDDLPYDRRYTSDIDGDGIGDQGDPDADGDGVNNDEDHNWTNPDIQYPGQELDSDNDGISDYDDLDNDNDGTLDTEDAFPFDGSESADSDGDGVGDNAQAEAEAAAAELEAEKKRLAELAQAEADAAAAKKEKEEKAAAAAAQAEAERIARGDFIEGDDFPLAADYPDQTGQNFLKLLTKWHVANPDSSPDFDRRDTDNDDIMNHYDSDDDNDGRFDKIDPFPLDPEEMYDNDNDGVGANADPDDNNPDVKNQADLDAFNAAEAARIAAEEADRIARGDFIEGDAFPKEADYPGKNYSDLLTKWYAANPEGKAGVDFRDTDNDGAINYLDEDDDDDGTLDANDAFPFDDMESTDTDGDGVGANTDADDNNKDIKTQVELDAFNEVEAARIAAEAAQAEADRIARGDFKAGDDFPEEADYPGKNYSDLLTKWYAANPEGKAGVDFRDTDNDGAINYLDADDDNDGLSDTYEQDQGLNPLKSDSDGDGTGDNADVFPLDASETADADNDGTGDNADVADDNKDIQTQVQLDAFNEAEAARIAKEASQAEADRIARGDFKAGDDFPEEADYPGKNYSDLLTKWYEANPEGKAGVDFRDTDNDGTINYLDEDDDGDSVSDLVELLSGSNSLKTDTDGDGINDFTEIYTYESDPAKADSDGDGLDDKYEIDEGLDIAKADSDGDGLLDGEEVDRGLDPLNTDSDNDGTDDGTDVFPTDNTEWADLDGDNIGDNSDNNIDGDFRLNIDDAFPFDRTETDDYDEDGVGDNSDPDIDGDSYLNEDDDFPKNKNEWADLDGDGKGDNSDTDIDGDEVKNNKDAFPRDATETKDTDNDGIGNNADDDDDGDSLLDVDEIERGLDPLNADSDDDGSPDNVDNAPDNKNYWDTDSQTEYEEEQAAEKKRMEENTAELTEGWEAQVAAMQEEQAKLAYEAAQDDIDARPDPEYLSPYDIDGDGTVDALTDGLLILRGFMTNFESKNLADKATNAGRTRTDEEIEEYLRSLVQDAPDSPLGKLFDVDEDGEIGGLSDGLAIFRRLFGLHSEALAKDILASDSTLPLADLDLLDRGKALEYLIDSTVNDIKFNTETGEVAYDYSEGKNLDPNAEGFTTELDYGVQGLPEGFVDNREVYNKDRTAEGDELSGADKLAAYDGQGPVPEGSGEEQIRKRFETIALGIQQAREMPVLANNPEAMEAHLAPGIAEVNEIKSKYPEAYAIVAADYNKDGGDAGVLDLDFFDVNPDVAGVTTAEESVAYDTEQAEIAARQQALDNYTGEGALPEGSGETQVRKRLQYWRDNAPATEEAAEARKTEAAQIAADYSTAFNAVKADFDTDEDGLIDLLDVRKDDPNVRTQQDLNDQTAQVERDKDLGVKITRPEGVYAADYSFTNSDARTMEFGYQGYDMPLTPDQLIEGYFAILNGEEWTDPRWEEANKTRGRKINIAAGNENLPADQRASESYTSRTSGNVMATGTRQRAEGFLERYTQAEIAYMGKSDQDSSEHETADITYGILGEDYITLEDIFEQRLPQAGEDINGPIRPDEPFDAVFIPGVDEIPAGADLAASYYDLRLLRGTEVADNWINGLMPEFKQSFDTYVDNQAGLQTKYNDYEGFASALVTSLPKGAIADAGNMYMLDPDVVDEWVKTVEDSEIKERGERVVAALRNFRDPDKEVTVVDRYVLGELEQTKEAYYEQFSGETYTGPDLYDDEGLEEIIFAGKSLMLADAFRNPDNYFGDPNSDVGSITALTSDLAYEKAAENAEFGQAMLAARHTTGNFYAAGNYIQDESGTINYQWNVDQAQFNERVKEGLWQSLLIEQEMPMWVQTDFFGYNDLAQNLTGEELDRAQKEQWGDSGLWYDPTRLYMKTPNRTGENQQVNSHGQINTAEYEDGLIDKNFEWGDETYRSVDGVGSVDINGNFREGYFESNRADENANPLITTNQTPYYGDFSNSGSSHNKGQGFFVDIGGEGSGYGSYTLIWVEQPEYQTDWDNFLNNPIMNTFVSFIPGGSIALAAMKRLNGQTLHGGDYFAAVIDGLKLSGQLQMPAGEDAAVAAGDDAVEAAMTEYPNISGAELRSIFDEAYSTAKLGVAPFDFLTPRQTVGFVKALTVDSDQLGLELVKVFGNDYFTSGLGKLGIDTSFLSPEVSGSINSIATDMLSGTSFEDAITREGASVTLDYFESLDISPQLKGFFNEFLGDIRPAIAAVELMGENVANSEFMQSAVDVIDTVYDSEEIQSIMQTGQVAFGFVGDLTSKMGDVASSFNTEVLEPLGNDIKSGMSKFTTVGGLYDNLPEDITGQIDKYVSDISTATGGAYDNIPEGLQEAIRESIISLLVGGEVDQLAVARAFSSAVVTVNAVSKLESGELGDLVDAISPQLLTSAIRNSLTAAILPGSPIDAGDALLGTIATGTVNAIKDAWNAGGLDGVIAEFSDFGDKISGEYGDLVDAAEKYNRTPALLAPLFEQRQTLQLALDADKEELQRLRNIAESADATDGELELYRNYAAVFNEGYDSRVAEITTLDGQIDGIIEENASDKEEYDAAVVKLTAETQLMDKNLVTYYDEIYSSTLYNLNPEFNLGQYATANGLTPEDGMATVTAKQVAQHYLTTGIKTGAPVNIDEYNERLAGYTPNLTTSALVSSGIDITRLDSTTVQQLENSMLSQADANAKAEDKTLVQYLEENAENPTPAYTAMLDNGIQSTFNMPNEEFEASLPQRGAIDFFRNLYTDFDDLSTQEQRALLTGVATDKITWVIKDGEVDWGADGFQRQEWNDQLQQFQTYQYDAGGQTKFLINDDGSIPLIGDREYLGVASVNNLSTIRANDPLEYFRFTTLALENNQPAIPWFAEEMAKYNRLLDEGASLEELEAVFANINDEARKYRFDQEGGFDGIPYSELPWSVRTAKRTLDNFDALITQQEIYIAELKEIENPDEADLIKLRDAEDQLVELSNTLSTSANAIRLAGGISNLVSTGAYAGLKYIETLPARLAAKLEFERVYLETGGDYAAAEAVKNATYLSGVKNVDFNVVSNHPNAKNMEMLESLSFGYLPEVYQADVNEFWKVLDEAEGAGDTFKALYGQLKDKPDVFLVEILGMEIGQELFTLAVSGGVGGLVTKAAAKNMASDIAKGMGVKAAVGTNIVLETGEIFAGTIDGTYDEAKQELLNIGYTDAAASAKAYEISVGAGTVAMLLASVVPGARALDNKVLSGGGNEALLSLAEKVFDGVDVTVKETLNEIIQETVSASYTELALYNAGVEGRDVTGNLAMTASIAGLAAAGTTATIYGLGVTNNNISGEGTGGGSNAVNPLTNAIIASPAAQAAISSGNPVQLELFLSSTGFTLDTPLTNNVMNIVDDGNYVSTVEAKETFDYLGVDPSSEDLFALAGKKTDDPEALILEGESYWVDTYGEENLGTGRTEAQHYDIIQHLDNMILGIVPLDSSFNMDGDAAITQGDIDYYIQEYLPDNEKLKYNRYVAQINLGQITHENTGIVEEQGGSLMTSAELEQLQSDIKTLKDRDPGLSSEEVATIIANDPGIKALPGQITAAVALEFSKEANQTSFANQVVAKLIEDGSIKTESKTAVKEVFGDPDGITTEEKGVFGVIEDIQSKLDLGEGEGTISKFISDQIGTAGTFDAEGNYNDDGTGLLGDLTKQGVDQGLDITEIKNLLGSEGDGTEANPPTGLFALAAGLTDVESTVDDIKTKVDNISSGLGMAADDPNNTTGQATGVYKAVADAINSATTEGAGAATEAILGDYVSLSAFQTAYEATTTEMVEEIKTEFGAPPVFETDDDGNIKRNEETGEPIIATAGEGFLGDMYDIMQMEGTERDLAMTALEGKIDSALNQVESVSSVATAEAIKNSVLDVYFPPKPADYDLGRNIAGQLDYINSLVTTGQFDADNDADADGAVTQADYDAVVDALSDEEKAALDGYNAWVATPDAITPMMETFTRETGTNFNVLNKRIDSVEANILSNIPEVDLTGLATTEDVTEATQDLVTDTELSQAIEGIQFPETDLTGLATTEDVTQAIEGIQFPETDLSGVATAEQAQDIQASVDQVATLLGKPPNLVTEADMEAVAVLVADFEIDSENVAQADMLRYDVSGVDGTPDGQIDIYDQNVLQAGFEGDYTGFDPNAQFNQATGMFLQQEQNQETITDMEQAAIEREAEFQNQLDLQRTQFQQDLDEREEEEKRDEFMKAFTAPGRTRTTTTPDDPADIKYFYDIAGDDIFANQQQDKFYGAASPFGDNFMNEILTPPRKKAKGGLIDETDEILKILGE